MFGALLSVLSSFAIVLTRKRELVALLHFSLLCLVTEFRGSSSPCVCLQCVIVVFPDHTHFLNALLVWPNLPYEGVSRLLWKFYRHIYVGTVMK